MDETGFLHDPCVYINLLQDNLRNRYENGFPVLKELVQNADDAGASFLRFGWSAGIAEAKHPLLRGPGIFAVNDGSFRPDDARAIRCLGLNAKAGDRSSIGKFGLGLKSVFHLCEAFFYLAGPGNTLRGWILNPWSGPADSSFSSHQEWNRFPRDEQEQVRRHVAPLLGPGEWFCVWIPLRQKQHGEGCDPIVEEYPGDEATPPAWMTAAERPCDFAALLPLLRNLTEVSMWCPWEQQSVASFAVRLSSVDRRRYDGTSTIPGRRFFDGTVTVTRDGTTTQPVCYSGVEDWVAELEGEHKQPGWPKSFALNRATQKVERIPEKADPHCGVVFLAWPDAQGGLTTAKAVFLPLTRTTTDQPCAGKERFCVLLHGYFFVDAGRGDLEVVDAAGDGRGESYLRARWNDTLWRTGTIGLLLPCLEHFVRKGVLAGNDSVVSLTGALLQSALF
jgi:hypothetical protein